MRCAKKSFYGQNVGIFVAIQVSVRLLAEAASLLLGQIATLPNNVGKSIPKSDIIV